MEDKKMLGIYLDEVLKKRVRALAKKLGLSTSNFVKRVLEFTVNTFDAHEKQKTDSSDAQAELLAEQFKKEIVKEVIDELKKES